MKAKSGILRGGILSGLCLQLSVVLGLFNSIMQETFASAVRCVNSEKAGDNSFDIKYDSFRYGMSYIDPESGMYYLKARYYSPELMSFISRDTYDLHNRYAYCEGNPVSNTDPDGHKADKRVWIPLAVGAVAVTAIAIGTGLAIKKFCFSGAAQGPIEAAENAAPEIRVPDPSPPPTPPPPRSACSVQNDPDSLDIRFREWVGNNTNSGTDRRAYFEHLVYDADKERCLGCKTGTRPICDCLDAIGDDDVIPHGQNGHVCEGGCDKRYVDPFVQEAEEKRERIRAEYIVTLERENDLKYWSEKHGGALYTSTFGGTRSSREVVYQPREKWTEGGSFKAYPVFNRFVSGIAPAVPWF